MNLIRSKNDFLFFSDLFARRLLYKSFPTRRLWSMQSLVLQLTYCVIFRDNFSKSSNFSLLTNKIQIFQRRLTRNSYRINKLFSQLIELCQKFDIFHKTSREVFQQKTSRKVFSAVGESLLTVGGSLLTVSESRLRLPLQLKNKTQIFNFNFN